MRWIILLVIYLLVDIYAFQAVRTLSRNYWVYGLYFTISLLVIGVVIYQLTDQSSSRVLSPNRMLAFGLLLAVFVPKIVLIIFMFGEDVVRLFVGVYFKVTDPKEAYFIPSRRKFISTVALGIAAIPLASLLYGMYRGKYNYKVLKYVLEFDDLPEAFDGYTLTQISDIHSGSFDNRKKVQYAVDLVNEQKSDVILFTGDLVNNVAAEMNDWFTMFSELKAEDGVFSVLGNHDYGDYVDWESSEAKIENLDRLKALQGEMGWNLLLNEHRYLERNGERLALIGVENWGAGGFKKAGNLEQACEGLATNEFKILMSHDPSHWQAEVKESEKNVHLTLSGHTHGMQFGIEIPGWIKWSPVKYRYENWAGIYEEFGRYINVNRGFGYLGYPGRVGIWPEITVIQLKKRKNV
ncbi:metallophosphoesterase [Ulvibacter antarcticus]|uniref:Calcineurin-like phosphoesterase domain-containing protein n=1 Tax=Ulvibacter antarcticus TaxID=442714 RepID=A0A3L9Z0W8_9FLAO|nr:metallophosphoesterase [Ulvibacter antarcticus]RMA65750.1 hypothetical protein BXY75_0163 [Ulvibacter antarcticus]